MCVFRYLRFRRRPLLPRLAPLGWPNVGPRSYQVQVVLYHCPFRLVNYPSFTASFHPSSKLLGSAAVAAVVRFESTVLSFSAALFAASEIGVGGAFGAGGIAGGVLVCLYSLTSPATSSGVPCSST